LKFPRDLPRLSAQMYLVLSKSGLHLCQKGPQGHLFRLCKGLGGILGHRNVVPQGLGVHCRLKTKGGRSWVDRTGGKKLVIREVCLIVPNELRSIYRCL
jgi:hypothetical protein